MARYVRVSTFATPALRFDGGVKLHGQEAVDRMIAHWRGQLEAVWPDQPDLIVLPEACDRFPEHTHEERAAYYQARKEQVRDFFAGVARDHHCYVAYSAYREVEGGTFRNSTQVLDRAGNVAGIYNKNHVVIDETTQDHVLCGKDAPIIECDFGRVACAICFDLNFNELRLKYVQAQPDMILFSSMYHGGLMQAYWAYSCRAHFVAACCDLPSAIFAPTGEMLASTTNYFSSVTTAINLDCRLAHLDYNWGKFDAMRAKYGSKVRRHDPGFLGSVLISSETPEFTIDEVAKEFDIELLDAYMARSLAHHRNPANIEP